MLFLRNISYTKLPLLLVSLFWAFMLSGQGAQARAATIAPSGIHSHSSEPDQQETSTLTKGDQQVVQDATTSSVVITSQQAEVPVHGAAFLAPTDDAIPPYAARAPGQSFLTRIFPTTIQPNAP